MLKAQYLVPIGARLNSIGNASVVVSDPFSIFSNPSSVTDSTLKTIAFFSDFRYSISGLTTMALAYNQSIGKLKVLTGLSRHGDDLLNHSRIEMALAYKIRLVSLGGGIGCHQLIVSENGVGRAITVQFGGTVEITPKLFYGAHAYNMLRAKVAKESTIYYPVVMKTGFIYKPYKGFFLSAELEKDSRFDPNFKLGLEYKIIDWFVIRTGINTNPSIGFFGVGLKLKEFNVDYGISHHTRIGFLHFFGLTTFFGQNEKQ